MSYEDAAPVKMPYEKVTEVTEFQDALSKNQIESMESDLRDGMQREAGNKLKNAAMKVEDSETAEKMKEVAQHLLVMPNTGVPEPPLDVSTLDPEQLAEQQKLSYNPNLD